MCNIYMYGHRARSGWGIYQHISDRDLGGAYITSICMAIDRDLGGAYITSICMAIDRDLGEAYITSICMAIDRDLGGAYITSYMYGHRSRSG